MLKSFRNRKPSPTKRAMKKRLRLESLEAKAMLAGDVTAAVVNGDLFITGDAGDNEFEIVRDVTQATPGAGEITIRGLPGTTINGMAEETFNFSGADAVTGDVELDLTAGGFDSVTVSGTATDNLAFLDDFLIFGGSLGEHEVFFVNVDVGGDLNHTSLAADLALLDIESSLVGGNVIFESSAAFSDSVVRDSSITGSVLVESSGSEFAIDLDDSFLGGDLDVTAVGEVADIIASSIEVGDDFILDLELTDIVDVALFSTGTRNTIGDDFRISSVALDNQIEIAETDIVDDLRSELGDGLNVFDLIDVTIGDDFSAVDGNNGTLFSEYIIESTIIGDDVYVSGNGGEDLIAFEGVTVGDNFRVSAGDGADTVELIDSDVTDDALISLGQDFDELSVLDVTADRFRVFGRGDNEIFLGNLDVNRSVTVLTSSGADIVEIGNVDAQSLLVAVGAGDDQVIIGSNQIFDQPPATVDNSEIDWVFVFLGAGNDSLELNGLDATFALLSGGSGEDTLVDAEDANDITFNIDFAFEDFPA